MAATTVGTTAVELVFGRGRIIILQNLDATNNIYFSDSPDVTTSTGIQIAPGVAWESPEPLTGPKGLWVIADGAGTDLRSEGL